ncbi:MAG: serine/threonine protein kinase, partial [Planctomycetota bacterium]
MPRADQTDRTATTSLSERQRRLQLTQTIAISKVSGRAPLRESSLDQLIAAGLPRRPDYDLESAARLVNESYGDEPRYAMRSCLGSGSNGVVFAAWDRQLEREVAVKVSRSADQQEVDVFLREAQVIAGLEHPGIVPVHDLARGSDGRGWYSMRRLRGESLQTLILREMDRIDRGEVPQSGLNERVTCMLRTCEAMAFAHAHQVIHQDVKPGNIMIDVYGDITVVDWGSALTPTSRHLTENLRGTPAYMAPEQARGGEEMDPSCDVYALGGTLFELLYWRLPLEEPDDDIFWSMKSRGAIREPAPEELARVPAPLHAIAMKAMAPDRRDRYPDAAAMRTDLARFQAGLSVSAYVDDPLGMLLRLIRRYRTPIAASVVALLLIGATVLLWQRSELRNQRSIALGVTVDQTLERRDLLTTPVQDRLQDQLVELARLDVEAYRAALERSRRRVADRAQEILEQPGFDEGKEALVQQALSFLEADAALHAHVQEALQQRRRAWRTLVQITTPVVQATGGWEEAWTATDAGLLLGMADAEVEPGLHGVPTPVSAAGALRVRLGFPGQQLAPGERLGVVFELLTGGSYALFIETDPERPEVLMATALRSATVLDREIGLQGPVRELEVM